jgi:hypothetical protein
LTRIPVFASMSWAAELLRRPSIACLEVVYAGHPIPPKVEAREVFFRSEGITRVRLPRMWDTHRYHDTPTRTGFLIRNVHHPPCRPLDRVEYADRVEGKQPGLSLCQCLVNVK